MIRKIEVGREEYERRVLRTLRKELIEGGYKGQPGGSARITVEDVRLDISRPKHLVIILFRDKTRPGCLFGYRSPAIEVEIEPSADHIVLDSQGGYWGPEEWASVITVTHFEEQVWSTTLGLPQDCDPGDITWVDNHWLMPHNSDQTG